MIKKIGKVFLWLSIVFVALILIAFLAVRILFPAEKIKRILIAQIEANLNRKATIDAISLNPFKGFTLDDIVLYNKNLSDTAAVDTYEFVRCRKILLNYKFSSLLKKEIQINEIRIDEPHVYLHQDQNLRWNFDDLIAVDTTAAVDTAAVEISLPFTVKLKQFSLNNLTAYVSLNQADTVYTFRTGGLSGIIDDLFLPRKTFDDLTKGARAKLTIFSDQRPWDFAIETRSPWERIEIRTGVNLQLDVQVDGLEKIKTEGELSLHDFSLRIKQTTPFPEQNFRSPLAQLASVSFSLTTNAMLGDLFIKKFETKFAEEPIFDIEGSITDFANQPQVDLVVSNSHVNLKNLSDLFFPLLPDTIKNQMKNFSLTGWASFRGSEITGNPLSENSEEALAFNLKCNIADLSVRYTDPETKLENLKLQAAISGIYTINGFQKTDVKTKVTADTFSVAVDTLTYAFAGLNLNLVSTLNSEFFPDSLQANFRIDDFFEVPLDFWLNFKSDGRIDKYQAVGKLTCNQLPLLKLSEGSVDTRINTIIDLTSQSLDQINAQVTMTSDQIELPMEPAPLLLNPLRIDGDLILATDLNFEKIDLRPSPISINHFASGTIRGDFLFLPEQKLSLYFDQLKIDHKKFLAYLPASLLEGFESLKVSGATNATLQIVIVIPEYEDVIIDITGRALLRAGVQYPDVDVTLKLLESQIDFQTNSISGSWQSRTLLDSLFIGGLIDEPLRNITARIDGRFPDLETIILDSSFLTIPDLMTQVIMTGEIDSLSGNMRLKLNGLLTLDAEKEAVDLANFINISGKLIQKTDLSLINNIAQVTGFINCQDLNVKYMDLAEVDSIAGIIHFSHKIDINTSAIISEMREQPFLAEAGAYYYDVLRPYYQQPRDQLSYFHIGKIKAMDYYASDLNLDLHIRNERIEIPKFSLNLYDGNLSGLIYINLHEGNLDQVDWRIKANLASMNSAKLLPTINLKAKGSELNMNLGLSGTGLDPATKFEVSGYLYVTQIGPQFMDNVLRSLDPKGTDKSIQDTRKLLAWGYKPKLVSVEIKHDNLYPTIHLTKARLLTKLIPLNLSGSKIELARIPLKFFLSDMMAKTE